MKKVLMVCLGNICRSPLAQGILEKKAQEHRLKLIVDSAGTTAYHVNERPDHRSVAKAKEYGIDINQQRARQFVEEDFLYFDIIYAMDRNNYRDIVLLSRTDDEKNKVRLILNHIYHGEDLSVPDPYYGGDHGFENVYQMLNQACDEIIKELKNG